MAIKSCETEGTCKWLSRVKRFQRQLVKALYCISCLFMFYRKMISGFIRHFVQVHRPTGLSVIFIDSADLTKYEIKRQANILVKIPIFVYVEQSSQVKLIESCQQIKMAYAI